MAKKSLAKEFGFKHGETYPVLFTVTEDNQKIASRPQHKTFKFSFNKTGEEEGILKQGTYKIIKGSVPMSAFIKSNLIPNDANPREGIYYNNRLGTVETIVNNPMLLPFSFGCSVIVSDMKYDHKKITFTTREPYKNEKTNEIRKTGCFNGQNLMYMLATINEKICSGEVEYGFNTDDVKIPFEFIVFSDDVLNSDILKVCEIKNSTIQQSATALATMNGDFDKYLFDSLIHGIEMKLGEAKTDIEYRKVVDDILAGKFDKDDSALSRFTGSRVDIISYFKVAAMIYYTVMRQAYYDKELHKLENWRKSGVYDKEDISRERKDIRRKSVDKIMMYGRHVMTASKDVLKANRNNDFPVFHPVLNEELMVKFFYEAHDTVVTFDYYDYFQKNPKAQEVLGFVENEEGVLSPFIRQPIRYKLPVGIVTFIPFLFGCFCDNVEDEDGCETIKCFVDFKKFWEENYTAILDKIVAYKESPEGMSDSYCLYNPYGNGCVNLWNQLRDFCVDKKSKYTLRGHKKVKGAVKE